MGRKGEGKEGRRVGEGERWCREKRERERKNVEKSASGTFLEVKPGFPNTSTSSMEKRSFSQQC